MKSNLILVSTAICLFTNMIYCFAQDSILNLRGYPSEEGTIKIEWDPIQCDEQCNGEEPIYYMSMVDMSNVSGPPRDTDEQFNPQLTDQYTQLDGSQETFLFRYSNQRPTFYSGSFLFTLWVVNNKNELVTQSSTLVTYSNYKRIISAGGVLVMGVGALAIILKNVRDDIVRRNALRVALQAQWQAARQFNHQRNREMLRLRSICVDRGM